MILTVGELRSLINERKSDVEFHRLARRFHNELVSKLRNVSEDTIMSYKRNGVHGAAVSLEDLEIESLPKNMLKMYVGVQVGQKSSPYYVDYGMFTPPGDGDEYGMLELGYNLDIDDKRRWILTTNKKDVVAKWMRIVGSKVVATERTNFYHEFRHAYDYFVSFGAEHPEFVETPYSIEGNEPDNLKKYFNSNAEFNAFVSETMGKVIDQFIDQHDGEPVVSDAKRWVPDGHALYEKFVSNLKGGFKKYVDVDVIMKRAFPRMLATWDNYVDGLPKSKLHTFDSYSGERAK